MKLLVTGDFHLDYNSIEEMSEIINQIMYYNFDGIAVLGDIFDKSRPHPDAIALFVSFLQRIPETIPIYIIAGNHDKNKDEDATAFIPYLNKSNIIYNSESLKVMIGNKKVTMLHTNVNESKMGPKDMQLSSISYKNIEGDIILLGHIHKSQIISEIPLVLHPGCPFYYNFGEREDKKGFYMVDISDKVTYTFNSLHITPMYQFNITNADLHNIDNKLVDLPFQSKVKIVFNLDTCDLNTSTLIREIIKNYKDKFKIFKYEVNVAKSNIEVSTLVKQETITQLLEEFCKKENIDIEIKKTLEDSLK